MARDKIEIAPLSTPGARQATYAKRKLGIVKKAKDLSILCDARLALLLFSPAGKPSLTLGQNSELGAILERFYMIHPREREKRRCDILKILRKTCRKQNHEVNMNMLSSEGPEKAEEYNNILRGLQAEIIEKNEKLRSWSDPEDICDISLLSTMEGSLVKALEQLRHQKQCLEEQHALKTPAVLEAWCSSNSGNPNVVHQSSSGVRDSIRPHGELLCSNMSQEGDADAETTLNLQPDYDLDGLENLMRGIDFGLFDDTSSL